ncbi:hypothetical protein CPB84DRAFT_1545213 [Gymnopilus junonius]|uniref:Secreted protein n=1 Tax=Gymnopilus junonius TaxID=109634 RepID=A0A9P5NBR0_GYMJU|nr:hypothetical protein CPB84DRAFT_417774 [Gymnopilus junonius]KAF8886216.1 hypothetical protein CPB84DRAFT_1545213 [Gymnopilus junonius]
MSFPLLSASAFFLWSLLLPNFNFHLVAGKVKLLEWHSSLSTPRLLCEVQWSSGYDFCLTRDSQKVSSSILD